MKNENSKRETILRAAGEVVLGSGVSSMTLEAVAARAGVSKGGLLYHFASKDALVEAMVARLVEEFDAAIEAEIERDRKRRGSSQMGRWLRAYVRVGTTPESDFDALSYSLMAAFATKPELLDAMKEADARWQKRAENDGLAPELATIVRLAADGCWLSCLFGFGAGLESDAQMRAVQRGLLEIIENAPKIGSQEAKA